MINPDEIRGGLAQGEFFLEYLPTVSLVDGRCTGAEALARWRRPAGVVQPMDFIPEAENTTIVGLITYWVIDTVAHEMGAWLRAHPDAHISINVPPELFGRGGIEYVANQSGLIELASQIVLELTERGLPDMIGLNAINQAQAHGIRVAVDDATLHGGANVAVLARANIDIIKLDKSTVGQIRPECPHPPWLDDMAALNRSPRLTVIAEGVETAQQLAVLQAVGIKAAQGFYFSQPIVAAAFIDFYAATQAPGSNRVLPPAAA
jgi:sensor c-di-GMP phosphodiesterase-like protein